MEGADPATRRAGPPSAVGWATPSAPGGRTLGFDLGSLATDADRPLGRFGRVRFIAVDTPWHGFPGPSDRGADAFLMAMARLVLPEGLDDMRAASAMFAGDPGSDDPVARAGLLNVE